MSDKISVVITANGEGSRMKGLSPKPKHLLYYGEKRIIDHIRDAFFAFGYKAEVLEGKPTNSRKETLEFLRGRKNVLVCDCDVIPKLRITDEVSDSDVIICFRSANPKYGGLYTNDGLLSMVIEKGDAHTDCRASGVYFLKDVGATIDRMTDPNSIASGMIGAKVIYENTPFIRLGDPEDYLAALK